MSKLLESIDVHSTWKKDEVFYNQIIELLEGNKQLIGIENEIGPSCSYTPRKEKVLRFFETNLEEICVVILGQDPYPQAGVATGRAFEVGNISTWRDHTSQTSLINIIKSIYKMEKDIAEKKDVKEKDVKISEIRNEIENDNFNINLSIECWFNNLKEQGVLFLNTAFTCEIDGKPNSHRTHWEDFTITIINHIITKRPDCTWLIWGNNAKKIMEKCKDTKKYKSPHPVNASFYKVDNCFKKTKKIIKTKNGKPIDWLGNAPSKINSHKKESK